MSEDYDEVGVLRGDRLEPHVGMPDIGAIFSMNAPCRLLFWRGSQDSLTHHRCPLFNERTGVVPETALAVDWLHCASLGVFQFYIGNVLQILFTANVWQVCETTEEAIAMMSCGRLNSELTAWYRTEGGHATVIAGMRHTMFGTRASPECALKGAETNGLLEFLVTKVIRRFEFPNAVEIRRAGNALLTILSLIRQHRRVFPVEVVQQVFDATSRYLQMHLKLGWAEKPKHHQLMHLCKSIQFLGSPSLYGNWYNETLNKLVKQIASGAHSLVWEQRLLSEFRLAAGVGAITDDDSSSGGLTSKMIYRGQY